MTHQFLNGGGYKHANSYLINRNPTSKCCINNTDATFVFVYFFPQASTLIMFLIRDGVKMSNFAELAVKKTGGQTHICCCVNICLLQMKVKRKYFTPKKVKTEPSVRRNLRRCLLFVGAFCASVLVKR